VAEGCPGIYTDLKSAHKRHIITCQQPPVLWAALFDAFVPVQWLIRRGIYELWCTSRMGFISELKGDTSLPQLSIVGV
jgi:hypothetical protein